MLTRQVVAAMNTLHLHFIHQFAVKSTARVRAERADLTASHVLAESGNGVEIGPPRG